MDVPTTWEELTAACKAIKEKCPDVYPWGIDMTTKKSKKVLMASSFSAEWPLSKHMKRSITPADTEGLLPLVGIAAKA